MSITLLLFKIHGPKKRAKGANSLLRDLIVLVFNNDIYLTNPTMIVR